MSTISLKIALAALLLGMFASSNEVDSKLEFVFIGNRQENAVKSLVASKTSADALNQSKSFVVPEAVGISSASVHVPGSQDANAVALKDKYRVVEVEKFSVLEGADLPPDYIGALQEHIITEFQNSGVFKQVFSSSQTQPGTNDFELRVAGTVTYFDPGNRAERYFGSGAGYLVVYVVFKDRSTDETLVTDQVVATLSGGIFGGSSKSITKEFAKTLTTTTKLLLETWLTPPEERASPEGAGPRPSRPDDKIVAIVAPNFDDGQSALNSAASAGYQFATFTPNGINGGDAIMERTANPAQVYQYLILHAHLFGNLQKDMNKAALEGFRYCPNTLSWLAGGFGGAGVVIMEKPPVRPMKNYEYRVHAPMQVSNGQKDIANDQRERFRLVGTLEASSMHVALMERVGD